MSEEESELSPRQGLSIAEVGSLIEEFESSIGAYVRSLLPGYPHAEDVTQEVLLTIWKKRSDFTAGSNFKAWAFQIAKYHVLNQRRKIVRSKWLVFDEELMDQFEPGAVAEEDSVFAEEAEALESCLKQLRPEDQKL
jgi:RNA polymerase sigma-70 factor (ECF subfamily)